MNIIGVVGWKNTGKTTLIEKLIKEFTKRNFTVSTIKHSHHNFSIDRQGTDSYRHFNAGTKETILASEQEWIKFSNQRSNQKLNLPILDLQSPFRAIWTSNPDSPYRFHPFGSEIIDFGQNKPISGNF